MFIDLRERPACLLAALNYLRRGWSALALCPPDHSVLGAEHAASCSSPGKRPLGAWKDFQRRQATPEELMRAWARCPSANVGAAMGPASGLVGVDVDNAEGERILATLADGEPPATLEFATPGGGRRLLYALPAGADMSVRSYRRDGKEALRLLGAGAQTVMPPSRHANGGEYRWAAGRAPDQIAVAPAPAWLLAAPADPQPDAPAPRIAESTRPEGDPLARARRYVARCPAAVSGQGGHGRTFAVARRLASFGLSAEEIFAVLRDDYNPRCRPPWTDRELRHKAEDAVRRATTLPTATGAAGGACQRPGSVARTAETTLRPMSAVAARPVEWLWPGWVPLGKLTVLDGDPGLGKSTLLLDLAARVSRDGRMPDGSVGPNGATVILSAEDGEEDTIKPRLTAAGGVEDRLFTLSAIRGADGEGRPPEIPGDLAAIESAVASCGARLLLIDPLMAYLCGVDASRDQDVRRALFKLARLAERQNCAVICQRHLNKGGGDKAIYRGGGSIGIIGAARAGLLAAADPADPRKRVLAVTKCNLAEPPRPLRFGLEPSGTVCRVAWLGGADYTADDLLLRPPSGGRGDEAPPGRLDEAREFLRRLLTAGPKASSLCYQEGQAVGFSRRTLERAVQALALVRRHGFENAAGEMTFELPPPDDDGGRADAS